MLPTTSIRSLCISWRLTVMGLLALPNELISDILALTLPYDFENFAVTCNPIWLLADALLPHHNELRRRYRRFHFTRHEFPRPHVTDTIDSVPELLLAIADEPVIADYIVHANLGGRRTLEGGVSNADHTPWGRADLLERLRTEAGQQQLKRLIQRSEHLSTLGQDVDSWYQRILRDGGEHHRSVDFPLAFLFSLLTNVKSLSLSSEWSESCVNPETEHPEGELDPVERGVSALMQLLVSRANEMTLTGQPMQRLSVLHPTHGTDPQLGVDMVTIAPFLALASLRELHHRDGVYEIDNASSGNSTRHWPRHFRLGGNLEVMQLDDYVIGKAAAAHLFRQTPKLRILSLHYQSKENLGGDEWQPNSLISNLMSEVGGMLEELAVTLGAWTYVYEPIQGSLHGFTALRKLELSVGLFYRHHDFENFRSERVIFREDIPALGDLLPSSVCTLTLQLCATGVEVACLRGLLQGFAAQRASQLPRLAQFTVVIDSRDYAGRFVANAKALKRVVDSAKQCCEETGGIDVE